MFILLLPGVISTGMGLGIVRLIEAARRPFRAH